MKKSQSLLILVIVNILYFCGGQELPDDGFFYHTDPVDMAAAQGFIPQYIERANIVYDESMSFVFDRDINLNLNQITSATQNDDWIISETTLCTDAIVIQQKAQLLSQVSKLLPNRPVMFVNCECTECTDFPSVSLPSIRMFWVNPGTGAKHPAVVIGAEYMQPSTSFVIADVKIDIHSEEHTKHFIVNLNQWINIQDKSSFSGVSGYFSQYTPLFESIFKVYAKQLPFSQTVLLQMVPLGSSYLNMFPTVQERSFKSNFIDFVYCGRTVNTQRFCNGGKFEGNAHGGFAFQGEEHQDVAQLAISRLFDSSKVNTNRHVRTLTNQYAEYQDRIAHTCCFANNPAGAWVGESYPVKHVGNELPHEFGHTYSLPDWAGAHTFRQKHRSYSLDQNMSVVLPFSSNHMSQRGCMNGGSTGPTDTLFTQMNVYSNEMAEYVMASSNQMDPYILKNYKNGVKSLVFVVNGRDILAYRINVDLPKTSTQTNQPSGDNYFHLLYYDGTTGALVYNIYIPFVNQFVLNDFVGNLQGRIVVEWPKYSLVKTFFLRNDGIDLVAPIEGVLASDYPSSSIYVADTQEKLNNLQNNLDDLLLGGKYIQIAIYLSQNAFISGLNLKAFGSLFLTNIYIENEGASIFTVTMGSRTTVINPGKGGSFVYNNGWKRTTNNPNLSPTYTYTSMQTDNTNGIVETTAMFENIFGANYRNILAHTYDGRHRPILTLPPVSNQFVGNSYTAFRTSTIGVRVIIQGGAEFILARDETAYFIYENGWSGQIFEISESPIIPNENYYANCGEIQSMDDMDNVRNLFRFNSKIVSKVTDACFTDEINLPDMSYNYIGRAMDVSRTSVSSFVINNGIYGLIPSIGFDMRFTAINPWTEIDQLENIYIQTKHIERVNSCKISNNLSNSTMYIQRNLSAINPMSTTYIANLADLEKFKTDHTYIFTLWDTYDVVIARYANGLWAERFTMLPIDGYYKYTGKTVNIIVNSTYKVILDFGVSQIVLINGEARDYTIGLGWNTNTLYNDLPIGVIP